MSLILHLQDQGQFQGHNLLILCMIVSYSSNRFSRLIKAPKIHLTDTGLACALLGVVAADLRDERTLSEADRRGLERLRDAVGSSFRCGALLYDGETLVPQGERIYAIPLRMIWNGQ